MKKLAGFILAMVVAVALAGCGDRSEADDESQVESQTGEGFQAESISGKHHVEITIADYGTVSVELDADVAPVSVANFLNLASDGFYDGLTFHRIMTGFMIQGGDPKGNGRGGSDTNIKGEFALNGVENNLSHTRGAISMARASDYDSASSQFRSEERRVGKECRL